MLSVHFGPVPKGDTPFEWTATDKHKAFKRVEGVTPLGFYQEYVSAKADQMVSIINDPRNPYHTCVASSKLWFPREVVLHLFRGVSDVCREGPLKSFVFDDFVVEIVLSTRNVKRG